MNNSGQFIETFFEKLAGECDEQIIRWLEDKASSTMDDFVLNTMNKWELQLAEYGYAIMSSEAWLFQILVGRLLWCLINRLLPQGTRPVKTKISSDASWYYRWESGGREIIFSINARLYKIPHYVLPRRRADIAVIVDGIVEVYLETKMYPNQAINEITKAYKSDLGSTACHISKNVTKRLIFLNAFGKRSDVPRRLVEQGIPRGEWFCVKDRKGQLYRVFQEIEAKSKTWHTK